MLKAFPLASHPKYCLHPFQVMKLGKWDLVYQIPQSHRDAIAAKLNPHLSKEQRVSSQWQNGGRGAERFPLAHESTSIYSNTPTPKHTHTSSHKHSEPD